MKLELHLDEPELKVLNAVLAAHTGPKEEISVAEDVLRAIKREVERQEKAEREKESDHSGYGQARAQMSSIADMVAALEFWTEDGHERLEELEADKKQLEETLADAKKAYDEASDDERMDGELGDEVEEAETELKEWLEENGQELQELIDAKGDTEDEDDARQRIHDDALSIELTGTWEPGADPEADGFEILLCTGGPAVRIVGEFDARFNEPRRAWLEYQDWFTPWNEYHGENACGETLLKYCREHYFGD